MIGLLLCLGMLNASDPAIEKDVDKAKASLIEARKEYEKSTESISSDIIREIDKKIKDERSLKKPNSKVITDLKNEKTKFEQNNEIPPSISSKFKQRVRQARKSLITALEAMSAAYLRAEEDDKAAEIEKVIQEVKEASEHHVHLSKSIGQKVGSQETVFNQTVAITSRKEFAHPVGSLKQGDGIQLQYLSGKWKAWGNYATESPDDVVQEQIGDMCRLAICMLEESGKTKVIAVVPAGTKEKPFDWVADKDYGMIYLRINDKDGDFNTNLGTVSYRLKIIVSNVTK